MASARSSAEIWGIADGKLQRLSSFVPEHDYTPPSPFASAFGAVSVSPKRDEFVIADIDNRVILADIRTLKTIRQWQLDSCVRATAFSPDGNQLAIGTEDGSLFVFARDLRILTTGSKTNLPDEMTMLEFTNMADAAKLRGRTQFSLRGLLLTTVATGCWLATLRREPYLATVIASVVVSAMFAALVIRLGLGNASLLSGRTIGFLLVVVIALLAGDRVLVEKKLADKTRELEQVESVLGMDAEQVAAGLRTQERAFEEIARRGGTIIVYGNYVTGRCVSVDFQFGPATCGPDPERIVSHDRSVVPFTDDDVHYLYDIIDLNYVNLHGTCVSDGVAEDLRHSLPGCDVSWYAFSDR